MTYLWQQLSQTQPQTPALRDEAGNLFNWKNLNQRIQQTAFLLQQQGINEGAGVAFVGKNSFSILLIYLASIQLGARILGLNPSFNIEKCLELIHQNHIAFIFDESQHLPESKKYKKISILGAENFSLFDYPTPSPSRPSTMTLTSGSTGLPKAVVHSMQAHIDNANALCELMELTQESHYLLSLPLYHVSGQGIIWRWLLSAATLVLPRENFYLTLSQCTHASLVPTQAQRFVDFLEENTKKFNTQHLLLGGANIPFPLTQRLKEKDIQAYCGYGMTEMASTIFAKKANHTTGVGEILKGRECQLHQEEIYLKGNGLALGYWQNGKIKPLTNHKGFFATKDLGYIKNNELFLTGRRDNQFISGGENIHPEEIEKVLMLHPNISHAFVFPQQDKIFGNRPVALISSNTQSFEKLVDEIKSLLNIHLERFKHPIKYYPFKAEDFLKGNIKLNRNAVKTYFEQLIKENE